MEEVTKATPEQKLVHTAKEWRELDKVAIRDKASRAKQKAEYRARQQLRDAVDNTGSGQP